MPFQRFEALQEHPAEKRIRVVPSHLGPGDFQVPRHFGDGEAGGISLQETREPPKVHDPSLHILEELSCAENRVEFLRPVGEPG
jgi:hypothetical protein